MTAKKSKPAKPEAVVEETSLDSLVENETVEHPEYTPSPVKRLTNNRLNIILFGLLGLILIAAGLLVPRLFTKQAPQLPTEELNLGFDANGPYALLEPRRDGNALILNIKRVSDYEKITYELTYQSEGIDRGVQGEINGAKEGKSEYAQEVLFGTCSKGDTMDPLHCVFDKDVENGTLVLRIQKPAQPGDKFIKVYKMIIAWHFQKPDVALGKIVSGDNHFMYTTTADRATLANVGYSIVNDLSGAPKLPEGMTFLGKVYAINIPTAKSFPEGVVIIEEPQEPAPDSKIARFDDAKGDWQMLDTKITGSSLQSTASGSGIFAVVTSSK